MVERTRVVMIQEGNFWGFDCRLCEEVKHSLYKDYDTAVNLATYHAKLHDPSRSEWDIEYEHTTRDHIIRGEAGSEDSR